MKNIFKTSSTPDRKLVAVINGSALYYEDGFGAVRIVAPNVAAKAGFKYLEAVLLALPQSEPVYEGDSVVIQF